MKPVEFSPCKGKKTPQCHSHSMLDNGAQGPVRPKPFHAGGRRWDSSWWENSVPSPGENPSGSGSVQSSLSRKCQFRRVQLSRSPGCKPVPVWAVSSDRGTARSADFPASPPEPFAIAMLPQQGWFSYITTRPFHSPAPPQAPPGPSHPALACQQPQPISGRDGAPSPTSLGLLPLLFISSYSLLFLKSHLSLALVSQEPQTTLGTLGLSLQWLLGPSVATTGLLYQSWVCP